MGRIYIYIAAAAVICAGILYCYGNAVFRHVFAERAVPTEERIAMLEPYLTVMKPDGAEPFPVVIVLPGCLHTYSHNDAWHALFLELGYAVVVVDSFRARGLDRDSLDSVCAGLRVRGFDRAEDVRAAVAYVRQREWADGDSVVLAGWSHGGWAVMDAMRSYAADADGAGLIGVLLVYPYCGFGTAAYSGFRWDLPVPVLMQVAGSDRAANPKQCAAWYESQDSGYVNLSVFPDAEHTFDIPAPNNRNPERFSEIYAREAMDEAREFLSFVWRIGAFPVQ